MSCDIPREQVFSGPELRRDHNSEFDEFDDFDLDFSPEEEELLGDLLSAASAEETPASESAITSTPISTSLTPSQPSIPIVVPDIEDYELVSFIQSQSQSSKAFGEQVRSSQVDYPENIAHRISRLVEHPNSTESRQKQRRRDWELNNQQQRRELKANSTTVDERSPLERFRRPPRKGLSVTDLVSPAWCELQYWYSLTKHGRKKRTAAMKQGSVVHQALEDQVHTTVPVEVTTKEDAWALRIWNVIHGLRTLRNTGMTRELEVWGMVDGEVVTGIIDHLSYECPDPELEAAAAGVVGQRGDAGVKSSNDITSQDAYHPTLTEYFMSASGGGKKLSDLAITQSALEDGGEPSTEAGERIYITDVKTRSARNRSVPSASSAGFRPTLLQLHLYYHFLTRLASSDDITIADIASRYDLQQDKRLSDSFIAQVGSLNDGFYPDIDPSTTTIPSGPDSDYTPPLKPDDNADSMNILLNHNSLASLWSLMKDQLRLTFLPPSSPDPTMTTSPPSPTSTSASNPSTTTTILSPLLTATYIAAQSPPSSSPDPDSESPYIGSRSFAFDPQILYPYLSDEMRWWRGNRPAQGVHITEGWKCGICEFKAECTWRAAMEKDIAKKKGVEIG